MGWMLERVVNRPVAVIKAEEYHSLGNAGDSAPRGAAWSDRFSCRYGIDALAKGKQ